MNPALRDREEGSVMITVIIIAMISAAVAFTLSTVSGGLNTVRVDSDRANAFQYANAGIDQAVYRLDQAQLPVLADIPPAGSYTPTVVDGEVVAFTDTFVEADGSRYDISAAANPAGQSTNWTVQSIGTDANGQRLRHAVATVAAKPLFFDGFFTLSTFYLKGNQTTPIAYRSSQCIDPRAPFTCAITTFPVPGSLGTNSTFTAAAATIDSFKLRWEAFNMYDKPSQAAADFACDVGNCGTFPKVNAHTDPKDVFEDFPAVPDNAVACPSTFTGTITPGDYTCDVARFTGTVTVGSPVVVAGKTIRDVRVWATSRLYADDNAIINRANRPLRMQIYYNAPASPNNNSGICGAEIWALLYTPALEVSCNGSHQPTVFGAVIAQIHSGSGNHFDFHWDLDARSDLHNGKYKVQEWRECPPSVATAC